MVSLVESIIKDLNIVTTLGLYMKIEQMQF